MIAGPVDHIAVRTTDADALTVFLTDVLGLSRQGSNARRLFPLPGGVTLAVFAAGTPGGGLGSVEAEKLPDHIALRVEDVEAVRAVLAARGYVMEGDMVVAPGGLCLQFVEP